MLAPALSEHARRRAARFSADKSQRRFAELTVAALAGPGQARRTRREPASETELALVTVTHNSADQLGRLLESVHRHLPGARVIVVDSGSDDRSVAVANEAGVTVVELGENAGFGLGVEHRRGARGRAGVRAVNPDVELIDGTLAVLAAELADAAGPERILAPRLLSPAGAPQDSAQLDPSSRLQAGGAGPRTPSPPSRAAAKGARPRRSRRSRRVGWAVGACLVARSETFRRLGPFDERIFLFAEDLELGLRAGSEGVETWFRPMLVVLHLDAHTTAKAFDGEPFDLLASQRRAVIGELRGANAARRDHRLWMLTYINRIALKSLADVRRARRERRQLAAEWRAAVLLLASARGLVAVRVDPEARALLYRHSDQDRRDEPGSPVDQRPRPPLRVVIAVGLVAGCTLALQVLLTRIFSAVLFYHFSFLAISLALLGVGAGAIAVYLRPRWFERRRSSRCWRAGRRGWRAAACVMPLALVRLDYSTGPAAGHRRLRARSWRSLRARGACRSAWRAS